MSEQENLQQFREYMESERYREAYDIFKEKRRNR